MHPPQQVKILAAKVHVILGDPMFSYLRTHFPWTPTEGTASAMKELNEGGGTAYESMDDFWNAMGVRPSAE